MSITPHTIHANPGARKRRQRVGRGSARKGTTAGRGTKGQRARTGGRKGLKRKGLRQNLLNIPKNRGFASHYPKKNIITLQYIEEHFADAATITPKLLLQHKAIDTLEGGVKILGNGTITKKVVIDGCAVSKEARKKIEAAGGNIL